MTHPARAGRAPEDVVGGPPGGTEGELGGFGGGDLGEICFSVEWSLQEAVPRPGKPAEAFIAVTRAATTRLQACRSTGGRCPELRVDRST